MSLAALLQRRAVTPVTSSISTDVTAPGRAVAEGYAGYVGYAENSKGETKTDDAPLKACAPSVMSRLSVDENRQRRTIEIEVSGVTGVTANDTRAEPESPTKIRPAAAPAPLATASYGELVAWMDSTGETDAEIRREILVGYGFDPDFQYPDSGRRTCRQCANLDADGGCRAARRGQIPNASCHYTWPAGIDAPHRCVGYLPGPDDPDKRPGRERFDWPTAETQPDTGKAVCARCAHWTPDRINPSGGLGRCTIAAPASRRPGSLWPWPDAEIHCTRFQEITPC